jgi:soluble lytic murein transglycosylase-like protein
VRNGAIFTLVCAATLSPVASHAGTFWARERADGVVEFTNKTPPAGGRWKVWLKTGPGKAAALRGSTDIVPARDRSGDRFTRYDQHIRDQQALYGIPEALVRAVIKTESDYDPSVVSSAGAQGLMQLMPDTAKLMGVTDSFDPRQNIMGGCRYLQVLARRFCKTPSAAGMVCTSDEKVKIVAAYHAGPGAVEKYGGMPPYETTQAYVANVMRRYADLSRAVGGGGGEAP